MGTRRSRHNKGRKPSYKDHREIAMHLIAHPKTDWGSWAWTSTWWSDVEKFKLDVLCEADIDVEQAANVLGRSPRSIAHRARDFGLVLPPDWSKIIRPKYVPRQRQPMEAALAYPYIRKVRDEHADLLAINEMIPKSIPDNMRADMCQEIMLAVLEGRATLEALRAKRASGAYFIKKFYHDNYEAGGQAISFQQTDDDWTSERVASSIAAKEWHREQFTDRNSHADTLKTFTPPIQFEAAWRDQIGRITLRHHELGQFLSEEEVEEMLGDERCS